MRLIHLSEALRIFRRSLYIRKHGFKKYKGAPEQIAKQIIDSCWNKEKKYFQVSSGHFSEFYCRDFGMCAESLVNLGYRKQVISTLDYAISSFKANRRITTSISPRGCCFDFPKYGADSLPFVIHSLKVAKARDLLIKYEKFIISEIDYYMTTVFDVDSQLVKQGTSFSSMKDYSKRRSACYDNCMLSMLSEDLTSLKFYNPFSDYDIKKSILHNLWGGKYFYEDLSMKKVVTGDANTFPFWCGVIDSKNIFDLCMDSIEKAGLTKPFPLKYSSKREKTTDSISTEFVAGDYERDTVWIHLGLCFLDVVEKYDKKRLASFMKQYDDLITKHRNFLEVYDRNGNPFKTRFYAADESMLWVSKYLALKK